jgi:hypothetical protein
MMARPACFAGLVLLVLAAACQRGERADGTPPFQAPWDTVTRSPDAPRDSGDSARPTDVSLGGVHLGRELGRATVGGTELPIDGDPRYAARKTVPCAGDGDQCTVRLRIQWHDASGGQAVDGEVLYVTLRRPGQPEVRQEVTQNDLDLAVTIPGCGDVEVEVMLSAGTTPGLQSEVTVWASGATCG